MFQPGELVGNYRVLHQLGAGGMGVVYAAEHVHLGRPAAVKVLHPGVVASSPEIVERFRNEAIGGAAAEHRNVCRVLDLGQLAGGQWFIVLEFLSGESLSAFLARRAGQPVEPVVALHILAEAANGLHFAHERGIVHRDVKPENLFITETADDPYLVRVLDFGIAKLGEMAPGVQTRDHQVMGTLAYMAPEQLRGAGAVDRRADVYALAVVAYELLTGRSPLGHLTTLADAIAHHMAVTSPPDPRALRPDLRKALAKVVMRGLERDPRRRWPGMPEFIQALGSATERPGWTQGGMSIVEKRAVELSKSRSDAQTAGRHVPSALLAMGPASGPVTAPARPDAMPMTVSDGVPIVPSVPTPRTAIASPPAAPSPMVSTFGHSSGQVFPGSAAARSRRPLIAAVLGVGAIVVVAIVVLATRGGHDVESRAAVAPEPAPAVAIDASPAMSALAVVTEPAGATVLVDGIARGVAPVNVAVPSGARVVVRAELPGYESAEQTVAVGAEPAAVRLELASSEPPAAEPAAETALIKAPKSTKRHDGHRRERKRASTSADVPARPQPVPTKPPPPSRLGVDDVGGD